MPVSSPFTTFKRTFLNCFVRITYRGLPAPTGTGTYRNRPALTGLDRPGLFYDVFDKNFILNSPNRHDILKILIKNVIKQPEPVGAGTSSPRGRKKRCMVSVYFFLNLISTPRADRLES
jgi:hypothetical protein